MKNLLIALSCVLAPSVALAAGGGMEAYGEIVAIFILLAVVVFVISRLPTVDEVNHSAEFLSPAGDELAPAWAHVRLYMGRYNLKVSKFALEEMQDSAGGARS